jgi:hypothetical protein
MHQHATHSPDSLENEAMIRVGEKNFSWNEPKPGGEAQGTAPKISAGLPVEPTAGTLFSLSLANCRVLTSRAIDASPLLLVHL